MRPLILHVIPFLWSGAGGVVTRLCESQRQGGPVAIVTTGKSDGMSDWPAYRRRLRRAGVTHHTIDFFHRDGATFWIGIDALSRLLVEFKPSVVHAHAGVPAAAAAIAREVSGHRARVIGQMYSWGPDRPAWMDVQDMWGFGRADRVVCSARAYWNLLVEHGVPAHKLTYLPWGLPLDDLPFRSEDSKRRGKGAKKRGGPALGFVGRIEPRKAQVELVETLAHVRQRFPEATLDLVGPVADAAYASLLTSTIRAHKLQAAATLHDRVPNVVRFLNRWDLFVSLSSDEGQGLAVLEAMAVGVPVVARPVAGIEDFLTDNKTGIAIRQPDTASAARAIVRAAQDQALQHRVVQGARRLVERRYSWERMLAALTRLYESRP
jgi:glycosyltransferase involved in cell wall biosynthesis